MRRPPVLASFLALVLATAFILGVGHVHANQPGTPAAGAGFVGAWRLTSKTPFGVSPSLVTLMADGTVLSTDRPSQPGGAGFPVTFISAAHGVWHATSATTAAATWVEFVTDGKGNFIAVVTDSVEMTLGADGNSWSGQFSSTTTGPNGKVLFVGGGTAQATRITVQPLATPAASPAATPVPTTGG